eukprot:TRINITY_DN29374_c0_g1_i2.p1 TRINITY_DN29374_c0_g1~~TRINITY_DN29374_c0_g1_i2.p1  ORF type:complete len:239 (+),score=52.14 TRINITY_DN29374_c0_g1_i2:216-932(+)
MPAIIYREDHQQWLGAQPGAANVVASGSTVHSSLTATPAAVAAIGGHRGGQRCASFLASLWPVHANVAFIANISSSSDTNGSNAFVGHGNDGDAFESAGGGVVVNVEGRDDIVEGGVAGTDGLNGPLQPTRNPHEPVSWKVAVLKPEDPKVAADRRVAARLQAERHVAPPTGQRPSPLPFPPRSPPCLKHRSMLREFLHLDRKLGLPMDGKWPDYCVRRPGYQEPLEPPPAIGTEAAN